MHPQLLSDIVALCRRRIAEGDTPTEPAVSVESLEAALVQLADAPRQNQCGETCERAQVCATCMRSLASPAPQPELTDEQLRDALRECGTVAANALRPLWPYVAQFGRAVERAAKSQAPSVAGRKPLDEHQVRMLPILPTHGIADVVRIVEAAHCISAPEGKQP